MIDITARAAQHIQRAIREDLERLREIERRAEEDRPADFDAHDRAVLEDMVSEFDHARHISPESPSFQFAIATLFSYVATHRAELTASEFDELFRIYALMRTASIAHIVPGGSAKGALRAIAAFGSNGHET